MEKKTFIDYDLQLIGDNQYHQYPDLDINFYLPYSQYVKIVYNIVVGATSNDAHIVTRLFVDGKEIPEFRGISAYIAIPAVFKN